jgi:hypothetical protein
MSDGRGSYAPYPSTLPLTGLARRDCHEPGHWRVQGRLEDALDGLYRGEGAGGGDIGGGTGDAGRRASEDEMGYGCSR